MAESPEPSQPSKKPNQYNSYLKYSALGIQLLAALGICGWIGHKIDQWLQLKFPIFMLALGFLGFGGSLYQVYRSINKDQS
jgi:F0F1-type ATP synthase assembly protein I